MGRRNPPIPRTARELNKVCCDVPLKTRSPIHLNSSGRITGVSGRYTNFPWESHWIIFCWSLGCGSVDCGKRRVTQCGRIRFRLQKGQTNIYISNYNENRGCRFCLPPYLRIKLQYFQWNRTFSWVGFRGGLTFSDLFTLCNCFITQY